MLRPQEVTLVAAVHTLSLMSKECTQEVVLGGVGGTRRPSQATMSPVSQYSQTSPPNVPRKCCNKTVFLQVSPHSADEDIST